MAATTPTPRPPGLPALNHAAPLLAAVAAALVVYHRALAYFFSGSSGFGVGEIVAPCAGDVLSLGPPSIPLRMPCEPKKPSEWACFSRSVPRERANEGRCGTPQQSCPVPALAAFPTDGAEVHRNRSERGSAQPVSHSTA